MQSQTTKFTESGQESKKIQEVQEIVEIVETEMAKDVDSASSSEAGDAPILVSCEAKDCQKEGSPNQRLNQKFLGGKLLGDEKKDSGLNIGAMRFIPGDMTAREQILYSNLRKERDARILAIAKRRLDKKKRAQRKRKREQEHEMLLEQAAAAEKANSCLGERTGVELLICVKELIDVALFSWLVCYMLLTIFTEFEDCAHEWTLVVPTILSWIWSIENVLRWNISERAVVTKMVTLASFGGLAFHKMWLMPLVAAQDGEDFDYYMEIPYWFFPMLTSYVLNVFVTNKYRFTKLLTKYGCLDARKPRARGPERV